MKGPAALLRDVRGAAALEFALVALPFVMLMLGLLEFGRALYVKAAIDDALDRAQRIVLIDPSTDDSELESLVRALLEDLDGASLTVTPGEATEAGVDYRWITLVYDLDLVLPLPLAQTIPLEAERRIVQGP